MTRTTRFSLLIVAASLSMVSACSESPTAPVDLVVRKDASADSLIALGCGDTLPWGKAPCAQNR